MDRHAATRRLHHLADDAAVRLPRMHPHMLRYTFVTTMLNAGVDLRDIQIAARHADPRTTMRYDRTPRPNSSMGCAPDFATLTRPANLGRIWGDDQPPALPQSRLITHCYRPAPRPKAFPQVTGATAQRARFNRPP